MTGPTLDDILGRVRGELSEEDTEFFKDAAVTAFANAGQDEIAKDCPWAALGTYSTLTVYASPRYMLPEEMIEPSAAYMTLASGQRFYVDYIEPNALESRTSFSNGQTGIPRWCTTRRTDQGVELELFPAPSATGLALTVSGNIRPQPLVNGTDRTDLDPLCVQTLVDFVLWKCKRKDEEMEQAKEARDSFENSLRDLRARRMRSQVITKNVNRTRRSVFGWR